MPMVGEGFSFSGGLSGRKGGRGKSVILDPDGNVVAHVYGHVKVVNTDYKIQHSQMPAGADNLYARKYGRRFVPGPNTSSGAAILPELEQQAQEDIMTENPSGSELMGDGIF